MRKPARDAAELKASLQFTQNEVNYIKKSLHEKSDVLDDILKCIEIVASVQHEIENGIGYLEKQTRHNNLRIDGVTEGNTETWADTEAAMPRSLISALNISENQARDIRIEHAHRITGNSHSSKPTTIRVKFESFKDRETLLHAAHKQKSVFQQRPVSMRASQ